MATTEYVRKLKLLSTIKETAGAWDEASHPELTTPDDIDRWLRDVRGSWRQRPAEEHEADA